ncbi:MAG: hypothetical protein KGZ40_04995 [Clostridiales bacterium]|nr:hypothetical protein [Clostridiales bacterium]
MTALRADVYERDYILRLIASVGQMLRAMVHAVREQRPDDSLEIARDAVEALLDTPITLADALTGDGLVTFLSSGGQLDVVRARLLGEVLSARADAFELAREPERAEAERGRALTVLQAAEPLAEGNDAERIAEFIAAIGEG